MRVWVCEAVCDCDSVCDCDAEPDDDGLPDWVLVWVRLRVCVCDAVCEAVCVVELVTLCEGDCDWLAELDGVPV